MHRPSVRERMWHSRVDTSKKVVCATTRPCALVVQYSPTGSVSTRKTSTLCARLRSHSTSRRCQNPSTRTNVPLFPFYSSLSLPFSLYLDFIISVALLYYLILLLHVLSFSFIFLSFRHHFRLYASVSKQEASSSLPESWFGSLQKLHGVCCCLVYFELYSTKLIIRFV